jgi:hypothetical protein
LTSPFPESVHMQPHPLGWRKAKCIHLELELYGPSK